MKKRAIVLILDSLGVGYMEDAKESRPEDIGANTFYHILDQAEAINIPQLEHLGINQLLHHPRLSGREALASYGTLNLQHEGADSFAGHNEIMGTKPKVPHKVPFVEVMDEVKRALEQQGYHVMVPDEALPYLLVNGKVIVADNIETDYGQIYNVSGALDEIPFEEVLNIGQIVRQQVKVNRVIALGGERVSPAQLQAAVEKRQDGLVGVNSPKSGVYEQGYQVRHLGYGINPDTQATTLLLKAGKEVVLIGKMQDVITCEGARHFPAVETDKVMTCIIEQMDQTEEGLIAATVQETDLAGHAENVERYAQKISTVDQYLSTLLEKMSDDDLLIISADHGNDPTIGHSQHTREKTFLLAYGKQFKAADLGNRKTLSDIAATVTDFFDVRAPENGQSFYSSLIKP
ncbi:phosphopentomutase [Pullulanibacillus camelliae]|uniref:Phosphopentomutase n=1 Tax=Pullulanibacillus camelliae TaxID=1707096 RepID=A0A8J3E1X7_9BACL|nr:phosphopentomutase [Pullulanibacillus camelliae]GGE55379.1 phosphopentomutase [Pullulanibacillus camelliae]